MIKIKGKGKRQRMKKETYLKCIKFIESTPNGAKIINNLGKLFGFITVICYAFVIAGSAWGKLWTELAIYLGVPAVFFVGLSLFRRLYNAKRPYELYDFKPLIPKETIGKSFPSRHVFSIFAISTTLLYHYSFVGMILMYMGCFLAVIRVITGVHFPKDVIAGGIIGIVCGVVANILFYTM